MTIAVIAALLGFDLLLATVRPHAVGYREATAWSAFYIAVAVAFGLVFATLTGWGYGARYFAGYIVEKSLSVDNLFVFVIIMATFAVPREHQHRVLTFGIIAALALRAVFIALGAALLSLLSLMFLIFGCCWCGPPCGCTGIVTRTPTSGTTRWSVPHAGYCRSATPTSVAG